jgi:hypothetical protein
MSTVSRRAPTKTAVTIHALAADPTDPDFIAPQMGGAGETIGALRTQELQEAIQARRTAAGVAPLPPDPQKCNDLVGLALSGGGIRSAVYNLGFLQALSQRGLLRHVDYLCTVSGGGYIGGHVAALADNLGDQQVASAAASVAEQGPATETHLQSVTNGEPPRFKSFHDAQAGRDTSSRLADLGVDARGKLLPEYRFRHVGEYLFHDPVPFIWRYLIYTVPMIVLALSSLGVVATLIALIWRTLDLQYFRDILRWLGLPQLGTSLGLGDELPTAFLPCLFPLAMLIFGGVGCLTAERFHWPRGVKWCGRIAYLSVIVGAIFLGASLAVFLGNGETSLGGSLELIKVQSYLTGPLFLLTVLFLVPLVRFRSVVNSAREGAPEWQSIAARVVIGGACTCTPFFLIHWMARENISSIAKYRDPELLVEDVTQWPDFLRWREQLATETQNALSDAPPALPSIATQVRELAEYEDRFLGRMTRDRQALVYDSEKWVGLDLDPQAPVAAENAENVDTKSSTAGPKNPWIRPLWLPEYVLANIGLKTDSVVGGGRTKLIALRAAKAKNLAQFNGLLAKPKLSQALHHELCDAVAAESFEASTAKSQAERKLSAGDLNQFIAQRAAGLTSSERDQFNALWNRARGSELDQQPELAQLQQDGWTPLEIRQFNRLLLEIAHPEFIRHRAMVSTLIVPAYDQNERFRWLFAWGVLFAGACWFIDFNRTSPFFVYYRDRLHKRFLHMPKPGQAAPASQEAIAQAHSSVPVDHHESKLSELEPWKTGAPYPLFLGSLHLFDRVSPRGDRLGRDAVDADRCLPFLFSPLYCGSVYTGFRSTSEYCNGKLSVADAVAISGAAVTPFMTHNSGLLAMMAAFNLRIGKWLPRPDQKQLCKCEPAVKPLAVAREWWKARDESYRKKWRYALAADGGFHEFFGLEELLLRRCRLIIVSDAGCNNGKFEFGALADTIRLVRERHGIEFLDLDHDQPVDLHRLRRREGSSFQDQHHICLRVRYPDDFPVPGPKEAMIVYGQMSLTGDEPLDLQQFRKVNPNFPDEPTTNQSYDESQVESFRQLGYHVGEKICQRAPLRTNESDESAAVPVSIELWIDWLRWGYTADCSQVTPLSGNRLRKIDPCAEGLEFSPQRDLRWKDEQKFAADGFRQYLASAKVREESLLHVSQLLTDQPNRTDIRLNADELVKLVLACHDSRADFHCAGRRDLFEVGGRKTLIHAAAVASVKVKDQSGNVQGTHEGKIALAAAFYRQLCRGVFARGNSRTSALATLCLLDQIIVSDRVGEWRNALDCVVALTRLTKAGKLWKTKRVIASWYESQPAPTNGNPAAASADPGTAKGRVVQINAQNVKVSVSRP